MPIVREWCWFGASLAGHIGVVLLLVATLHPAQLGHDVRQSWAGQTTTELANEPWALAEVELAQVPLDVTPPMANEMAPSTEQVDEAPALPVESPDLEPNEATPPPLPAARPEPAQELEQKPPGKPRKEAAPEQPSSKPARQASQPKNPASNPADSETGDDFMSLDDQLPEPGADRPDLVQPQPEAPRDRLVERLLEAERRKQARRASRAANDNAAELDRPAPPRTPRSPVQRGEKTGTDLRERRVPPALTRAITEAEQRNPLWEGLPLGEVGQVRMYVEVERGEVVAGGVLGRSVPALKRMVKKAVRLIQRGRFAMPYTALDNGRQRFRIEVRLANSPLRDSIEPGYDAPTKERPGRAYFFLQEGRRFEAFVYPEP